MHCISNSHPFAPANVNYSSQHAGEVVLQQLESRTLYIMHSQVFMGFSWIHIGDKGYMDRP